MCAELCPTLSNPVDCSSSGFSVHGIILARILEYSGLPFPLPRIFLTQRQNLSLLWLHWQADSLPLAPPGRLRIIYCAVLSYSVRSDFATPWTVAHQALRRILQQEYWSGQPFPSPGDLPNPGIKPRSPSVQFSRSPYCHQGQGPPCPSPQLSGSLKRILWTLNLFLQPTIPALLAPSLHSSCISALTLQSLFGFFHELNTLLGASTIPSFHFSTSRVLFHLSGFFSALVGELD